MKTMPDNPLPRLLVVDDEPFNLSLIERIFRKGYEVVCVNSGQAALYTLEQTTFDVVLLDIMMPEMNGLTVLEAIRHRPETVELPVILVSAMSNSQDVANGLTLGANDYVVKPIDTDIMRARVDVQLTLKHYQDERKQMIAELEAANLMKEQFLRIASHDLKNPLHNIRLIHYMLETVVGDDPAGQELLATLDTTIENMQGVIEEFLDTTSLQGGAVDLHLQNAPVDHLIYEVAKQYQYHALKKNITLEMGESHSSLHADPARFMQALGNLISNAIKYSPSGGHVTVWADQCEDRVRISVADQGPGIPVDERSHLFTLFGKLTPRPTGGESSTGLGLWIVKHLVTLQHGEVGVECPPDGGSIFWIDLPAALYEHSMSA
jgi:two-component system, sensor histidine kinase and response regulator